MMSTNIQTLTTQIDALFAAWDKPDSPGCALAIIHNGEIVYKRGYGMVDLDHDLPITPASVFDIGSTAKQFTAMLMLLLAEQGLLTLDDDVRTYVPELPAYGDAITLRHLLHHTSGLREYTELGSRSIFFDWTDACISHPFIDMVEIFSARDAAIQTQLRAPYLSRWTAYEPMDRLQTMLEMAAPLCAFYLAINFHLDTPCPAH